MQWFAQAPSNIALIKYMGKKDSQKNIPDNPSLSYTLNNLLSSVMLEKTSGKKDYWEPLEIPGGLPFTLSSLAQQRFLNHLTLLKTYFNYQGAFIVRSCNNFPTSSGLASSASSFAALTKCAALALTELTQQPLPSQDTLAQLSRLGSGSSCRSFYSPWALWEEEEAKNITLPYPQLIHQVIIISHSEKSVSSKEAHERIKNSLLYPTRPQRAKENLKVLRLALEAQDWANAFQICWREFQDIHELFHTAHPFFSYFTENTKQVLSDLQALWQKQGDGPLVTMDAGPNVHLLYRPEQADLALSYKRDKLVGNYDVL